MSDEKIGVNPSEGPELITIHSSPDAEQPFNYSAGRHGTRFLRELRDSRRLLGVKCEACGRVYVPPREVCGPCFRKTGEWVEVGPGGVLDTYTILRFPFVDPETGEQRPVPYVYAFIRFDGADTRLQHFVEYVEGQEIKIGARVEPVFSDERHGTLRDILHFRLVD